VPSAEVAIKELNQYPPSCLLLHSVLTNDTIELCFYGLHWRQVKDYLVLGSAVVPKMNNIIIEGTIMSNTLFSCVPRHYAVVVLSSLSNVRFCRDSSAASQSGCGGVLSIQSGSRWSWPTG